MGTLSRLLDEPRIAYAIFTVGQYNMLAMALKILRLEREPGRARL